MRNGLRCTLIAGLLGLALAGTSQDASAAFRVGIQDDDAITAPPPSGRRPSPAPSRSGPAGFASTWCGRAIQDLGFGPYDRAVNEARARGMRVQLDHGQPGVRQRRARLHRPRTARRYASWAGRVARHFRGRVYAYSIWNEAQPRHVLPAPKQARAGPLRQAVPRRLSDGEARRPPGEDPGRRDGALEQAAALPRRSSQGRRAARRLGPPPVSVHAGRSGSPGAPLHRHLQHGHDEARPEGPRPAQASAHAEREAGETVLHGVRLPPARVPLRDLLRGHARRLFGAVHAHRPACRRRGHGLVPGLQPGPQHAGHRVGHRSRGPRRHRVPGVPAPCRRPAPRSPVARGRVPSRGGPAPLRRRPPRAGAPDRWWPSTATRSCPDQLHRRRDHDRPHDKCVEQDAQRP